jgi:mannose-6-phosphate isomerase-like protein (cupin superfamily)
MKKSHLISGLIITVLFACNNNSQNSKQQDKPADSTKAISTSVEQENMIKKGFESNIEKDALENTNFRKVLYTGKHLQLVLMSLKPGEEIGEEIHSNIDQFFRFESGKGKCIINGNKYNVENGDVIVVPAGAKHNVINTDAAKELKLYTIYSPPNHEEGITRATKEDAEKDEEKFDGKTTE